MIIKPKTNEHKSYEITTYQLSDVEIEYIIEDYFKALSRHNTGSKVEVDINTGFVKVTRDIL